jgi:hypothetical protein
MKHGACPAAVAVVCATAAAEYALFSIKLHKAIDNKSILAHTSCINFADVMLY